MFVIAKLCFNFLYGRFKLGAQSGLNGSNRVATLAKMKSPLQTFNVEFFSASLHCVKSVSTRRFSGQNTEKYGHFSGNVRLNL